MSLHPVTKIVLFGTVVLIAALFSHAQGEIEILQCYERPRGHGHCKAILGGYRYNTLTGECEMAQVVGCSAEFPFESIESCQQICQK